MHELLTPSEMAQADRLTIAGGRPGIVLMEAAGRAVAEAVAAGIQGEARIAVVAGPGNNGGDGFVAARLLAERGQHVEVLLLGARADLKGDAAVAAAAWSGPTYPAEPARLRGADVMVDALFGAGLARPLDGTALALVEAMNASGARIVAVDLPSGISGETGAVMGGAVRAEETVTFFRRKPGHLLLPGRMHCGRVTVADIGIEADVLDQVRPQTFENRPALWRAVFPVPRTDGHKYARGHAVVVSGGVSTTGAARLAARGALRAGAGLVTIASPMNALLVNATANLAIMVRGADGPEGLASLLSDTRINAVALGPGGGTGEAMRAQVSIALGGERAVVLDADALTSFADDPESLFGAIRARAEPTILTPHGGEFSRLFKNMDAPSKGHSKLSAVRAAARISGATVLLKGGDTVVATPDGHATIADNAPPWLATAGAGDVLAGMIAGLLAQGMPAFEAASAGVWLHGEAAAAFGPGLIAEDLPETLPRVYRSLLSDQDRVCASS
ncbi:MAG: NAD(P)H-hydrate dehydratase [Variibacter sp.]